MGWQAAPELNPSASAGVFEPGTLIKETNAGGTIRMIGLEANFRYPFGD